jgi:hypothetical protein
MTGRTECAGCGLWLYGQAYEVPGVSRSYCSVGCAETDLFGGEHCRWCGADMESAYTSIGSRLCSEDCSADHRAYVRGDKSAVVGSGKRLRLWLAAREAAKKTLVRGRHTKNGHAMSGAERVREFRRRNVTKIKPPSLLPRTSRNVTLQVIENTGEAAPENRV